MTKEEKALAAQKAAEMPNWTQSQWAKFLVAYHKDKAAASRAEIAYAAMKAHMSTTSTTRVEAGGFTASLSTSRGAGYTDWEAMARDLAIILNQDPDKLALDYFKRRADTTSIRFK